MTGCCRIASGLRRALFLAALALGAASYAATEAATERDSEGAGAATGEAPLVVVLDIDGAIGPATSSYVIDGLEEADSAGASLVVLRMDTPGGLATAMRDIISAILTSPVPVAAYVAPTGARAASAGTYITYAGHIAAMAPGTTLGAATPVQMGGSSPLPGPEPEKTDEDKGGDGAGKGEDGAEKGEDDAGKAPEDAMRAKVVNDATAYIRALAELRGRNAEWAVKAVREAATLTSTEAEVKNVVDLLAADIPTLVAKLDGRSVELESGSVMLELANARIERAPPDWRDELLATITDPNIAFILMMLGVYGLIFEFASPGSIVPGVLGAISLLVGLYALNVLPVNYAGLALILVGIAFMVAEAFVPSFGALGLGGLAAFALGGTILFDTGSAAYELSWWTVGTVTAVSGLVLILLVGMMVKSQRRPVATADESVAGRTAVVDDWRGGRGRVSLRGEYWNAIGPRGLRPGKAVTVIRRKGLTLEVTDEADAHHSNQSTGAEP